MARRSGRNPYDVLGVAQSATQEQIRSSYRALARRYHPDRSHPDAIHSDAVGTARSRESAVDPQQAADRMSEVNAAYRELSDPARRAMVDADLRGSTSAVPRSGRPTGYVQPDFEDEPLTKLPQAQMPWRSLLTFGFVAILAVLVLSQFDRSPADQGPDGILRNGDCVEIEPDLDAAEVSCAGTSDDLVVMAFVPFDGTCPTETAMHRDRQGMGMVCVAPRP